MGICDSNKINNKNKTEFSTEIKNCNKLKDCICLLIENDIDSFSYYYICIDNIYIPFFITNYRNIKNENSNTILYNKDCKILLFGLKPIIKYEKYRYFFFITREYQDNSKIVYLDNIILNEQINEIHIGENINLLGFNQEILYSSRIENINKNKNIFEFECTDKKVMNSYGNLIENSKKDIVGIKIGDKCGILFKPLLREFFMLKNKNYFNDNNSKKNTKYIIPLFLVFAKIEKLKIISDASFKEIKIEEDNIINLIRKFIINYQKKDDLNTKNIINEFEKMYNEKNTNFKKLIDFISNKSLQKFQIEKNENNKSFLQKQNEIQKLLFIIFKNQDRCSKCGLIKKQYICNNMYLYSENIQCSYLHSLIYDWENETNEKCSKCQDMSSNKGKIIYWPEILIVILNDNNIIKDIDKLRIQKYEKEYKLICYIGYSDNNNFNVFYKEQNKWYMIKNDDYFTSEEIQNKIKFLVKYPCVLFYEKIKSNSNNNNSIDLRNDETQSKTMLNNIINNNPKYKNTYLGVRNENKNIKTKTNSFDINYIKSNSINYGNANNPIFYYPANTNKKLNLNKLGNMNKHTFTHTSNTPLNNNLYNIPYSPIPQYLNNNTPINKNINYNNPYPNLNSNPNIYGHLNIPTQNTFLTQNNIYNNQIPINLEKKNNHISKTPIKTNNNHYIKYSINSGNSNISNYNTFSNINNNNRTNEITKFHLYKPPLNGNNNIKAKEVNSGNVNIPTPLNTLDSNTQNNNVFQNNQNFDNNINGTRIIKEAYTEQIINNNNLLLNENKFDKNSEKTNAKSNGSKINNNINNNNNGNENENEEEINLYFIFKNGKELYLDVKKSLPFSEVIKKLEEKYLWLKDNIKIKEYQFNGKKIDKNQIVKYIGLEDESEINIIESN